jgi:hypothetical protein
MNRISKKKLYIWIGIIAAVVGVGIFLAGYKNEFNISGSSVEKDKKISSISGQECENAGVRPFAVMVSSDAEARPLSGIGEADMVFEMPVVENGFTRMMAVFQCGRPKEVGSVRSSRLDFVPLALGLDAIYAHFGGEHEVLEELNSGIIDNIDGLKYDGTYYYRKKEIPRPHNSFTNFDLMTEIALKLGYNLDEAKVSYPHEEKSKSQGTAEPEPVFNENFRVIWRYNPGTNSYLRNRAGTDEIDKNTGRQIETKNVVIAETSASPINKDYIRVKTVGSGPATVYKDGITIDGSWEKKDDNAKMFFYDKDGKEINFAPGSIWVEIDAHLP